MTHFALRPHDTLRKKRCRPRGAREWSSAYVGSAPRPQPLSVACGTGFQPVKHHVQPAPCGRLVASGEAENFSH
jgi:hypothetical protein